MQILARLMHCECMAVKTTIYTIGHSNKSEEDFLDAIRSYGIDRVIDIRTKLYSRWFNGTISV
jgi:hypothetical protein